MADKTPISQLPAGALTGANVDVNADYLAIDDVSAGNTKKITPRELIANAPAYTPTGTIAATSVQGAIDEVVSDLAASTGSSLVGFVQSGSGAIARDLQTKAREVVSLADYDTAANFNTAVQALSATQKLAFGPAVWIGTGSANLDSQVLINGPFSGVVDAVAMFVNSTITIPVGGIGFGVEIQPVFVLAGSGTHSSVASLTVNAPTASGAAAVTQGITLNVAGAPTFGTTKYTALFGTGAVQIQGPNVAIGGAWDSTIQLRLLGNLAGVNQGILQTSTFNPVANADAFGIGTGITIQKAGSGTHAQFDTVFLQPPTIGADAGSALTNATTLRITAAPTGATNNRALWVQTGLTVLGGALNIAGALIAEGASSDDAAEANTLSIRRGQIGFPPTQISSTDVNTLDDYEEGTWTPAVGGTATYTTQNGRYTKIGHMVFVSAQFEINVLGTGSTTLISGLPFPSANTGLLQAGSVGYWGGLAVTTISLGVKTENNASTISFQGRSTAGAAVDNNLALFGNGARVDFNIAYETSF